MPPQCHHNRWVSRLGKSITFPFPFHLEVPSARVRGFPCMHFELIFQSPMPNSTPSARKSLTNITTSLMSLARIAEKCKSLGLRKLSGHSAATLKTFAWTPPSHHVGPDPAGSLGTQIRRPSGGSRLIQRRKSVTSRGAGG